MSTLSLVLSLSYNPEEIPTSFALHINSIEGDSGYWKVIGLGESNTQPNAENEFLIQVVVAECEIEEESTPFHLPLFDVDIADPNQLVIVTASADAGSSGQGSIKSVEAQNESRPIG